MRARLEWRKRRLPAMAAGNQRSEGAIKALQLFELVPYFSQMLQRQAIRFGAG